jgi:hypothetical protein
MATKKDAAAENAAPVEEKAREETEIEKIQRESAEWRQKFESSQGRLRVAEIRQGHDAESEDRMAKFVTDSIKTVISEDDPKKRGERLQEIGATRERERALSIRVTNTQGELDKLIADSKLDWVNDPDLADARAAWNDSKPEDAYRLASFVAREKSLQDDYTHNDDVDDIVQTSIRNARQDDSAVDTGNSTAASDLLTQDPRTQTELTAYLRIARLNKIQISKEERARLVRGATQT